MIHRSYLQRLGRMATIFALLAATAAAQAADSPADILRAADRFRTPATDMEVETVIGTYDKEGNAIKDNQAYTVFVQSNRRSLVVMRGPLKDGEVRAGNETGQRMLMLGPDFWLIMPGTSRPLRITPMQKLLGDASSGDVAAMNWAEDYTAEIAGEEACGESKCTRLKLTGARKGVTYQRIDLWVDKAARFPVRADLYVQSEKLAKRARFVMDRPARPTEVVEMVLTDEIANQRETRIRYTSKKQRTVPEAWLNPMFLASSAALAI